MNAEATQILNDFKGIVVFHPLFRQAFTQIQLAIESTQLLGDPCSALLCGPSGTGKSTLCHYIRKHYDSDQVTRRVDGTYANLPVFYCEVPSPTTVKGLVSNMLALLIGETPNGTTDKLTHQLIACLRTAQVKIIFLDEIQLLCVSRVSDKVRLDSLQWIVSMLNALGIPIILSGTEKCRNIRSENESFENRYPYFAELANFDYSTGTDTALYGTLHQLDLGMYDSAALEHGVHLNDPTIAAPLYVASRGNPKRIRLIISDALKNCLQRAGSRELRHDDFVEACEHLDLPKKLSKGNPFTLDLTQSLNLIDIYQEHLTRGVIDESEDEDD